eukprot:c40806_g1_i1 orf=86-727(-)
MYIYLCMYIHICECGYIRISILPFNNFCWRAPPASCMDFDEPQADQRPLFLVNVYIIHTVQFLNKFSSICEHKLAEVHRRLSCIETTLALLEAKLKSIDGVDNMVGASAFTVSQDQSRPSPDGVSENDSSVVSSSGLPSSDSTIAVEQPTVSEVSSPRTEQQPVPTIKDDPRFSRFFRMLRVGVPEKGVKLQMSLEGYDPSLLDNPDATSPTV